MHWYVCVCGCKLCIRLKMKQERIKYLKAPNDVSEALGIKC